MRGGALARSQEATQTRLARRATNADKNTLERELDRQLADARRKRDDALKAAASAHTKANRKAQEQYESDRDDLIRKAATKEAEAA